MRWHRLGCHLNSKNLEKSVCLFLFLFCFFNEIYYSPLETGNLSPKCKNKKKKKKERKKKKEKKKKERKPQLGSPPKGFKKGKN